jgi:hypothetical protein
MRSSSGNGAVDVYGIFACITSVIVGIKVNFSASALRTLDAVGNDSFFFDAACETQSRCMNVTAAGIDRFVSVAYDDSVRYINSDFSASFATVIDDVPAVVRTSSAVYSICSIDFPINSDVNAIIYSSITSLLAQALRLLRIV